MTRVFLVDDGSHNRSSLLPVYRRWSEEPGWCVRLLDRNAGKRAAQDEAVRRGTGELVVLMDSDTVLAPDAIRQAAATFADEISEVEINPLARRRRKCRVR